ncbi:hypothetical protein R1N_01850 [Enterobacter asburiae]|nr:hypothetical protein EAA2563_01780 [Enterobacter asburiae]BCP67998.1 hypothetical protein R1N_01850 [Enterobacter asburiae]
MAVVLQEKLRKFAEDNDKQNLNTPGVKRHEMQAERNEMPGNGNEWPGPGIKRQRVSIRYRCKARGCCIRDVIVTFKKVTTLEICANAEGV